MTVNLTFVRYIKTFNLRLYKEDEHQFKENQKYNYTKTEKKFGDSRRKRVQEIFGQRETQNKKTKDKSGKIA